MPTLHFKIHIYVSYVNTFYMKDENLDEIRASCVQDQRGSQTVKSEFAINIPDKCDEEQRTQLIYLNVRNRSAREVICFKYHATSIKNFNQDI